MKIKEKIDKLYQAAREQNLPDVLLWLDANCSSLLPVLNDDIESRQTDEQSNYQPSILAARDGRIDVMKLLYASGHDIHICYRTMQTSLGICAQLGHIDLANWILNHRGKVNAFSNHSVFLSSGLEKIIPMTPMEIAIVENNLEMALLLRAKGGRIGIKSPYGSTTLTNALIIKAHKVIYLLSCLGVNCLANDIIDLTPQDLKEVLSYGSDLEKCLCGFHLLNKLLDQLSDNFLDAQEAETIGNLTKELHEPIMHLINNIEVEDSFLIKLETKDALYKELHKRCSSVIDLRTDDSEFSNMCENLEKHISDGSISTQAYLSEDSELQKLMDLLGTDV